MKTLRRFWWLAAIGALVAALGVLLALPAWAAPSVQTTSPPSDTVAVMHAACAGGDLAGMQGAMDSLTDEDVQAMQGHMNGGHHGSMSSHMAGQGGMMGGMVGGTVSGMMNGQSGRAMMGW